MPLVRIEMIIGIYPYTSVTDKQREAMKQANVDYVYQSVFEIANNCLLNFYKRR